MKNLCIGAGILLLIAIPSGWPYGFYVLLRWIISFFSFYMAAEFHKSKLSGWTLVFIATGILFNPLIPIYLNKASWVPLDFIGAILFFVAAYSWKK